MKKSISCCLSHQNPATYSFRAVLASKQCLICADFSPDSDQTTDLYFCQKQQFEVKNVLMLDLFLTNTQLLASQYVNWWTGVVWITCGLLWCFYQLFISDGSIAEQVMECYISPNLFPSWPEGEHIANFWLNYSFNSPCRHRFDPAEENTPW